MTLEELIAKLKDAKLDTLVDPVVELVEQEKQRGIQATNKKNSENKNLRKYKTAFDALGYDHESDLDDFTSSLLEKIDSDKGGSGNEKTIKTLTQRVEKIQQELQVERGKAKQAKLSGALQEALGSKIHGSKYVISNLISEGKVDLDDNNSIVFKNGDDIQPFNDGLKSFLEENKDIVKADQKDGPGGRRVSSPNPGSNMTQLKDPDQIKANLASIKSELGIK